jgi:hypothetical protein
MPVYMDRKEFYVNKIIIKLIFIKKNLKLGKQ